MDATLFDRLTRSITAGSSRRTHLRFAVAALGLAAGRVPATAGAKSKNKKKPKPNEYGCLDVGKPCRGKDAKCCSGICQGKKPKKGKKDKSRCVAHNVLGCQAGQISCAGPPVACGDNGFCLQTTGNASFCGVSFGDCADCTKDTECEATQGEGAACIVCPGQCPDSGGRGCFAAAA